MVIENQNTPDLIACGICLGQVDLLLDNENLLRANAGQSARRRKVKQAGWRFSMDLRIRAWKGPIARAFPFHDLTLWRTIASPP